MTRSYFCIIIFIGTILFSSCTNDRIKDLVLEDIKTEASKYKNCKISQCNIKLFTPEKDSPLLDDRLFQKSIEIINNGYAINNNGFLYNHYVAYEDEQGHHIEITNAQRLKLMGDVENDTKRRKDKQNKLASEFDELANDIKPGSYNLFVVASTSLLFEMDDGTKEYKWYHCCYKLSKDGKHIDKKYTGDFFDYNPCDYIDKKIDGKYESEILQID